MCSGHYQFVSPITLTIKFVIPYDHSKIPGTLVLPRARAVSSSCDNVSNAFLEQIRSKLTSKGAETKAVSGSLEALSLAEDLIAIVGSRASNEAGLEAEGSQIVGTRGSLGELVDDGTGGHGDRVRLSVAQRTVGSNEDLLTAGDNNAEAEGLVTARKDSLGAGRARAGWEAGRAVAGGLAAEVELATTSLERQKVDGRGAAGRDDAEVAGAGGRSRSGRRSGSGTLSSGESTSDEACDSESVLHCDECVYSD